MNWFFSIKLREKIVILVCIIVLLALFATNKMVSLYVAEDITAQMGHAALSVARIVSKSDIVIEGLSGRRPAQDIQAYSNSIRDLSGYMLVVVFDMNGIRKSHPEQSSIGQHIVGGDETRALSGEEYLSFAAGTMGPQLRAFTPVYDGSTQVGAVVVGMHLNSVEQATAENRRRILLGSLPGLFIGIIGAVLIAHSVKKTLFGLEPQGIASLLEERNAMLYSVKEGILAVDKHARLTIANEAALKLLKNSGLPTDLLGQKVDDVIPNTELPRVLRTGLAEFDREQDLVGTKIITNRVPIMVGGKIVGALATFRDKTELNRMAEELTGVRSYVEALRSQSHEFMNKLHVILGLAQLQSYDKLTDYIQQIAHHQTQDVQFVGQRIKDSVVAGLLLSKLSRARELDVKLQISQDCFLPQLTENLRHEVVTILGNLLDNALEATLNAPIKNVSLLIDGEEATLLIRIQDSGSGLAPHIKGQITQKGFSTKGTNRGFGLYLVNTAVNNLHGSWSLDSTSNGTIAMVILPFEEDGFDDKSFNN